MRAINLFSFLGSQFTSHVFDFRSDLIVFCFNLSAVELVVQIRMMVFPARCDIRIYLSFKQCIDICFTKITGIGTAVFRSSIYLGARMLGYENIALYDGSWIEWLKKGYPIEDKTGEIILPENEYAEADEEQPSEGC